MTAEHCSLRSACRSNATNRTVRSGDIRLDSKGKPQTEVLEPEGESLPDVWPLPCLHAEVPDVPNLFPRPGLEWRDSWRQEGELVSGGP